MTAQPVRAQILAVDDDPGILRVVSRIFGQSHDVTCATSAKAALEAIKAFRPDVAIVDIRLPEVNGFDLMRRLHDVMPDLDVILMTRASAH